MEEVKIRWWSWIGVSKEIKINTWFRVGAGSGICNNLIFTKVVLLLPRNKKNTMCAEYVSSITEESQYLSTVSSTDQHNLAHTSKCVQKTQTH